MNDPIEEQEIKYTSSLDNSNDSIATEKNTPKISDLDLAPEDTIQSEIRSDDTTDDVVKVINIPQLPKTGLFRQIYSAFVSKPLRNLNSNTISKFKIMEPQLASSDIYEDMDIKQANRQRRLLLSNWSAQKMTALIGKIPFKANNMFNITPVSSHTRVMPNSLINRPYNIKSSTLETIMRDYRMHILASHQKNIHKKKPAFINAFNTNNGDIKIYNNDFKNIASSSKDLPYAQLLGYNIGKVNPSFLPWVRKRGNKRTHFFRQRKQNIVSNDELTPYTYLLRKRPSRLLAPAKLKLSALLTEAHRKNYVLTQLKSYPIKTQSLLLEIRIYS